MTQTVYNSLMLNNPNAKPKEKVVLFFLSAMVFFSAAWFLYILGLHSRDGGIYERIWHFTADTNFLDAYSQNRYEIGSYFLFWNLSQVFSAAMTFYFFGLIALSTKFYVFKKYFNYPLIVFCIYTLTFAYFLDGNQIRAALAFTVLLYALCVPPRNSFSYVILAIIAVQFHYSGIVILALYFTRFPLFGLALLVVVSFVFNWLLTSVSYLSFAKIWMASSDGQVNLTSSMFIMQVCIAIVCAFFWNKLSEQQKKGAYLNAFGVVAYVAFIDNAIVAHRIRELSMLGILAILFLGEKRLTYVKFISAICLAYVTLYNLATVVGRLA